jgi:hypothetical protein
MKTIFAILLMTVALGAYAEETETECQQMHESTERVVKTTQDADSDSSDTSGASLQ